MAETLTTLAIGLVSGVLSGAFGIGGGIITTPAIRLILGAPALVAVGTPLPVIIPSALTGAYNYHRARSADIRAGLTCGLAGSVFAVLGALATRFVGGTFVLLATAALILYVAGDMVLQTIRPPRVELEAAEEADAFGARPSDAVPVVAPASPRDPQPSLGRLALAGAVTGVYSGFLGLGGGFVLVPILTRWFGFRIKRAIGTSLFVISVLAVPGTVTHALLGHIDWRIAAVLAAGVIPGAWFGARITLGAGDRTIRIAFAVMLVVVGTWLALSELGWMPR